MAENRGGPFAQQRWLDALPSDVRRPASRSYASEIARPAHESHAKKQMFCFKWVDSAKMECTRSAATLKRVFVPKPQALLEVSSFAEWLSFDIEAGQTRNFVFVCAPPIFEEWVCAQPREAQWLKHNSADLVFFLNAPCSCAASLVPKPAH